MNESTLTKLLFFSILQLFKLFFLVTTVDYWIIDGFHHAFYTYWPTYWNGAFLTNPYSFYWQLFYLPTAIIGWVYTMSYFWIFDSLLMIVVFKFQSTKYAAICFFSSMFFCLYSPEDLFCFWLAVLGKEKWPISIFSAIVKLPTLAPGYVWIFIFEKSILSQSDIPNNLLAIPRYIFLGIWIIHPFISKAVNSFWFILNKIVDQIEPIT